MTTESTLRFGAQTDEVTSLLRIVNLVRTGEASTRPEIGKVTGLGRGVVSQRVDQAIEIGFLGDGEFGASSGGRAPRTLRFRAEQGRIIICALGAAHVHVGFTALDGDIQGHAHRPWDIAQGPVKTLDMVMALVDDMLKNHPDVPVWGVVVGLPGPVDFASGQPVAPPIMPGWNGFDVRTPFEERFNAPVWVDNDVNLLALGERARRRDSLADLIYCKIGSGIGAGLLSQGRIHRGANGSAGDIGHVRVSDSDAQCRCGKIGCLEAVAGGWALVRDAEEAINGGASSSLATRANKGTLSMEDITLAAQAGDALAITLVQKSARVAGETISALVNMFNPGVIVIGGAMGSAGEVFLAEVRQRVYELSLPLATRDLTITLSVNDPREPLRGGAELAREQLFDITFPRWFADGRPSPERAAVPA
ncbi:putative NBD/HSP70 family sugar kinase [Arthrobacter pascens]|uniref:ROK family protein n=1 Tax=Arthrobacter pascens TaxID=1677 RepID=UPI002793DB52|nr:ROK family protein [Arthrobacter pascens]MDQ0678789.1 putative NBD/HSP70 family sugar kinase [Arthrobacter pascens]